MGSRKDNFWIWGFHSVLSALRNAPDSISEIQLIKSEISERVRKEIEQICKEKKIRKSDVKEMPKSAQDHRHQGIAASIRFFSYKAEGELLKQLKLLKGTFSQWVLLDGIEDPRNFGAIMRSASAFGVRGIIVGEKYQAPVSGVVAQASAGTCFQIPIYQLQTTLKLTDSLRENQIMARLIGMDGRGRELEDLVRSLPLLDRPTIWVLGAEGKGIHSRLRDKIENFVRIDIDDRVESLNASVAASIVFYSARHAYPTGEPEVKAGHKHYT